MTDQTIEDHLFLCQSNRNQSLTHQGRVTHICISKLTIIGSDNGLSPGWRQAIIWTSAAILLIRPMGTNFSEILIVIYTFSFEKMHLKMSSGKWQPSCLGLNVLNNYTWFISTLWYFKCLLLKSHNSILCPHNSIFTTGKITLKFRYFHRTKCLWKILSAMVLQSWWRQNSFWTHIKPVTDHETFSGAQ